MTSLQFLNHASYKCETDEFIILCDPWLEGSAFNNGWALLDNSTKNDQLIDELSASRKKIFIWYSHEHSDHFAIPFLKKLKSARPDTKFFFQKTEDDRVVSYLRSNDFNIKVLKDGEIENLSKTSWISIFSWKSGDSFSIMSIDGNTILNLNDCIVASKQDCEVISNFLNDLNVHSLDVLFTQFGYASWCGNENEIDLRKLEADEKLKRIAIQIKVLKPKSTVLFASFVFFCSDYNFYLNDAQNTPYTVRESHQLKRVQNDIFFMKPYDIVSLDINLNKCLREKTKEAEKHWQDSYQRAKPQSINRNTYNIEDILKAFRSYKLKIHKAFLGIFVLVEMIGVIKPLRVNIIDLNKVITLSYLRGTRVSELTHGWDIAMHSDDIFFSVTRDFGFDCIHVNGRFRSASSETNNRFLYFSGPQNLLKSGFGYKKPIKTFKELLRLAKR